MSEVCMDLESRLGTKWKVPPGAIHLGCSKEMLAIHVVCSGQLLQMLSIMDRQKLEVASYRNKSSQDSWCSSTLQHRLQLVALVAVARGSCLCWLHNQDAPDDQQRETHALHFPFSRTN